MGIFLRRRRKNYPLRSISVRGNNQSPLTLTPCSFEIFFLFVCILKPKWACGAEGDSIRASLCSIIEINLLFCYNTKKYCVV